MNPIRRLKFAVAAIALVGVVGTVGYTALGWGLLDALYMTVITVTTVGYREVGTMDAPAMVFTIALISSGFGTVFYAFSTVIEMIVAGQLGEVLGGRKLQRRIDALEDHYIVCGLGRMGHVVCRELAHDDLPFVAVERDEAVIEEETGPGYLCVKGDATDEDTLIRAGVKRAKGLVAVLSTDAENLFVILSARALNPRLDIVARAADERSEHKLLRAGATRVVAPYFLGGARIAQALLRPSVLDFIEIATRRGRMDLLMEECLVSRGSELVDTAVRDSGIRRDLGLIVVAIKRPSGDMVFNPPADFMITAGDVLLALGQNDELQKLRQIAAGD